jgi:Invasion associated locus B (IalB) protein
LPAPLAATRQHPAARTPRPAPSAPSPKSIGVWERWQAATHQEGGQLVCYAFTRAVSSTPAVPGRGDVVLTVTERTGSRDAVAISAGYAYPKNATAEVQVEGTKLPFYTAGRSAFARDGKTAVSAFQKGREVVARAPAPRGQVTDNFSLRGFGAAYAAILKECPAR